MKAIGIRFTAALIEKTRGERPAGLRAADHPISNPEIGLPQDGPPIRFPKLTLYETSRRSEDRLQNNPAICDERNEQVQRAAQDCVRDLAVLDVHPDDLRRLELLGRVH